MAAPKHQHMTLEQFNNMDVNDGMTYELIGGMVMMSPRPAINHQKILRQLTLMTGNYLMNKTCNVMPEAEVELGEDVFVPDLYIYCDESKLGKQRYKGAPTIVIEILSPSTAFNDLNLKLKSYEKYGVKEYWIVSPNAKSVTIHHFENETVHEYVLDEVVGSDVFQDLKINLKDVFEV